MGAVVRVSPELENLVRSTPKGFIVESQGLPNLIHELVHALEAGYLADDHDFPYREIPLNPRNVGHRRLLWDELACCLLSCAFTPQHERVDWFLEQLEIQPVFYGMEDNPADFVRLVDEVFSKWGAQFDDYLVTVRGRLVRELCSHMPAGSLSDVKWPEFDALWRVYRERTLAKG